MISDPDQWRLDPEVTGYGASVMDLGIYAINTDRVLLRREPEAVQAQMDSMHPTFEDVHDERATAIVRFEDSIQLSFTVSQNAQTASVLTITGIEGELESEIAFTGDSALTVTVGDLSVHTTDQEFDFTQEMTEEFE